MVCCASRQHVFLLLLFFTKEKDVVYNISFAKGEREKDIPWKYGT